MDTQTLPAPGTMQAQLMTFTSLRRVLVVGHEYLLDQGVTQLLTYRRNLEVFHTEDHDPNVLAQYIEKIHPDVIILCHIDLSLEKNLIEQLICAPTMAELGIIIVHLQNIELNVCQNNHWFTADFSAFLPLVYGKKAEDQFDSF